MKPGILITVVFLSSSSLAVARTPRNFSLVEILAICDAVGIVRIEEQTGQVCEELVSLRPQRTVSFEWEIQWRRSSTLPAMDVECTQPRLTYRKFRALPPGRYLAFLWLSQDGELECEARYLFDIDSVQTVQWHWPSPEAGQTNDRIDLGLAQELVDNSIIYDHAQVFQLDCRLSFSPLQPNAEFYRVGFSSHCPPSPSWKKTGSGEFSLSGHLRSDRLRADVAEQLGRSTNAYRIDGDWIDGWFTITDIVDLRSGNSYLEQELNAPEATDGEFAGEENAPSG